MIKHYSVRNTFSVPKVFILAGTTILVCFKLVVSITKQVHLSLYSEGKILTQPTALSAPEKQYEFMKVLLFCKYNKQPPDIFSFNKSAHENIRWLFILFSFIILKNLTLTIIVRTWSNNVSYYNAAGCK